ncbi:hypothetical protein GCM10023091_27890 [Ravibacter arvi]|uniref:DUF5723 domain-containing protein n=1 Tax=Ravibacter arvi TaxID=2051041 RepID=A0ABP8M2S3_9BACT
MLALPTLYLQAQEKKSTTRIVTLSGGINAYAGLYTTSRTLNRNLPTPFGINGSVTVALPGGVSLPFSATLGNQGSSFRQPFNQFGASPTYKWATAHVGYRNVSFSPFTLAGHTFLGAGVELNPGKLRLGAVYGRFNKAISGTITEPGLLPSFKRTGYAVKIGYGKPNQYIDLVMLRARDDTNSLATTPKDTNRATPPAENLVLGLSSRLLLVRHLIIEADVATSAYTRDLHATAVSAEGKNIAVRWFGKLITPRFSTQLTHAVQLASGYTGKWGSVKVLYKRIDPNFQTMGAYYFQSDIVSYSLASSLNFLKGKIRLSGSYGRQFDNLAGNKNAGTGRSIGSLSVSLNPDPTLGFDLSLSNYGLSQRAGLRPLIDTLRIAQNNLSVTTSIRYALFNPETAHIFNLNATHQQLADLNEFTAAQTETSNQNVNLGYFFQQNKSGLGLNLQLSYTQSAIPLVDANGAAGTARLRYYGPTAGVNYAFLKKKMNVTANTSYLFNSQGRMTGKVMTASFQYGYRFTSRQQISFSFHHLISNTGIISEKFNETRANLGYGISF